MTYKCTLIDASGNPHEVEIEHPTYQDENGNELRAEFGSSTPVHCISEEGINKIYDSNGKMIVTATLPTFCVSERVCVFKKYEPLFEEIPCACGLSYEKNPEQFEVHEISLENNPYTNTEVFINAPRCKTCKTTVFIRKSESEVD